METMLSDGVLSPDSKPMSPDMLLLSPDSAQVPLVQEDSMSGDDAYTSNHSAINRVTSNPGDSSTSVPSDTLHSNLQTGNHGDSNQVDRNTTGDKDGNEESNYSDIRTANPGNYGDRSGMGIHGSASHDSRNIQQPTVPEQPQLEVGSELGDVMHVVSNYLQRKMVSQVFLYRKQICIAKSYTCIYTHLFRHINIYK